MQKAVALSLAAFFRFRTHFVGTIFLKPEGFLGRKGLERIHYIMITVRVPCRALAEGVG